MSGFFDDLVIPVAGVEKDMVPRTNTNLDQLSKLKPAFDRTTGAVTIMEDYRTRGTPWFIIIDASGEIVFSEFHLDADRLIERIDHIDIGSA